MNIYVMSYCGVCVCVCVCVVIKKTHRDGGVAPISVGWPHPHLGCSFFQVFYFFIFIF